MKKTSKYEYGRIEKLGQSLEAAGLAPDVTARIMEGGEEIGRRGGALADRIKAVGEAKLVFGRSVEIMPDGRLKVMFSPEGLPAYRCSCLPKASRPLPITYCYCCGGHVKHHLQNAVGHRLECEVRSSASSSGGKKPCTFVFESVG